LAVIRPRLIVLLGGTAARSVTGRAMNVMRERGQLFEHAGLTLLLTVHPSYLLRLPHMNARDAEHVRFVQDLALAKPFCSAPALS
jgi:DNA polymerase